MRVVCPYFLQKLRQLYWIERGAEVYIGRADYGHGWLEIWKGARLLRNSYEAGLYRYFIEHLTRCPKNRRYLGLTVRDVRHILQDIEDELKS